MTEPVLSEAARPLQDERTLPIVVYVLYLLGPVNGLTVLIGFILAYALKGKAVEPARSHYVFQIRTVWLWLAGLAVAAILMMFALPLTLVLIGFAIIPVAITLASAVTVWMFVRSVVGLIFIARGQPYPRPDAWLI
jgi:uncharacterized membrane protein